jgi:hypothetical protein
MMVNSLSLQAVLLAALKTALHNLLNTLKEAAKKPGDVKVAIIPFDRMVNIGTGFHGRFLDRLFGQEHREVRLDGCVIDRDQSHDVSDTAPVATNYHTCR